MKEKQKIEPEAKQKKKLSLSSKIMIGMGLVSCQVSIDGYRRANLIMASSVANCQFTIDL